MTMTLICRVVGIKSYSGTMRETNEPYSGKHFHVTYNEPGVTGQAVSTQKVSDKVPGCRDVAVGREYVFTFEATEYNGETRLKVSAIQPLNKN